MPEVHAMAVKVLIPRNGDAPLQQDFIMADHVIFFSRNVQHVLDFLSPLQAARRLARWQ